jgi:hypothetical protein
VKFRTDALTGLVEEDDPVESVWKSMWGIWNPSGDTVSDHYRREGQMKNYEQLLVDVYHEFYSDILPNCCVNDSALEIPEEGTFVVMDAMSVREAALFTEYLDSRGRDPTIGYSFSSVPSETIPYRERVGYGEIKREYKTTDVKTDDPTLDGDEDLVWCRYPDALLENIQEGKTKVSTIEEMYEKTERTFGRIVDQLDTDRVVVGSDHGYIRLDSGNTFPVGEQNKNRLQETFGGRFESIADVDASALVDEGLVVESDGYYMPIGRYTWPKRGKYSTFTHGGLSLTECITPRIEFNL